MHSKMFVKTNGNEELKPVVIIMVDKISSTVVHKQLYRHSTLKTKNMFTIHESEALDHTC